MKVKLPLGIDRFEKLYASNCYYIDKTGFIRELLEESFEVNLITRPRRFGKTLTISMLAEFLDIRKDNKQVFDGLAISKDIEFYEEWRNQWPVLFFTLKDVNGRNFSTAYELLQYVISNLCMEHTYLEESEKMDEEYRQRFLRLKKRKGDEIDVRCALDTLLRMMNLYYGKNVILLIDEYDVPLAKAFDYGYYEEMLDVIRSLLGLAWKTNPALKFAVVTGCLRIAKESIFTGANNFISSSIAMEDYSNYFGFSKEEVLQLLKDTGLSDHAAEIKKWYDGYRFGSKEVYCPWDVLNHVHYLRKRAGVKPANYWKDTSHNEIIRRFIDMPNINVKDKFEILLAGGVVQENIVEDLTYDLVNTSEENLWSILYLTGYLTQDKELSESGKEEGTVRLRIPNEEVKTIFAETVAKWFRDTMAEMDRRELFQAWWDGEEKKLTMFVTDILFQTISYFDYKEDYYHAFLVGLFAGAGYEVSSNQEQGTGRADVIVKDQKNRRVMIIEVKRALSKGEMEKDCRKALQQIEREQYARNFLKGYQTILCYGAVFWGKECLIQKAG